MKREIKFRGIPIPEFKGYAIDGFVRGYLTRRFSHNADKNQKQIQQIYFDEEKGKEKAYVIEVDHETVGQFTGLKDKNDKEIYEGDIIRNQVNKKYKVVFKNFSFYFIALSDNQKYNFEQYLKMLKKANVFFELIGNVYENKELLK